MQPTNLLEVLPPPRDPEPDPVGAGTLGREDFLRMLIAQLENQDPLNPQDPTQFSAQLAQFSTLEQLISIRTAIEEMANPGAVNQVLSASNLIGREVLVSGDRFSLDTSASTQALEFELPEAASTSLVITNPNGAEVRRLDLGPRTGGRHAVSVEQLGELPPGLYEFRVEAHANGEPIAPTLFVRGRVTASAASDDSTTMVQIGNVELPLSSVIEIRSTTETRL